MYNEARVFSVHMRYNITWLIQRILWRISNLCCSSAASFRHKINKNDNVLDLKHESLISEEEKIRCNALSDAIFLEPGKDQKFIQLNTFQYFRLTSSFPQTTPTTLHPSDSSPRSGTPMYTRMVTSASPSSILQWMILSQESCRVSGGTQLRMWELFCSAWSVSSTNQTHPGDS